jgi:hypothetical protein
VAALVVIFTAATNMSAQKVEVDNPIMTGFKMTAGAMLFGLAFAVVATVLTAIASMFGMSQYTPFKVPVKIPGIGIVGGIKPSKAPSYQDKGLYTSSYY